MTPTIHAYRHPEWLTNTYLLFAGNDALIIDAGGPLSEFPDLPPHKLRAVLLTHTHHDHISSLGEVLGASGGAPIYCSTDESPSVTAALPLQDGQKLSLGAFEVTALHTPGHTRGHFAFLVDGAGVFTGDLLFRESVGGTTASNHADVAALRKSILEKILTLPPDTRVYPGHQEPTTVAHELARNKIVRAFRGDDAPGNRPCAYKGRPGHVLAECRDYDGDTKVWIRFEDGGEVVTAGSNLS